jgi:hypothetical protein
MRLAERSLGVGEVVLPRARVPFTAAPLEPLELTEEHEVEAVSRDWERPREAAPVAAQPQEPRLPAIRSAEPSLDVVVEREAPEIPAELPRSLRSARMPAAGEQAPAEPSRALRSAVVPAAGQPPAAVEPEPMPPPGAAVRFPGAETDRVHEPPRPATTLGRDPRQAVRATPATREGPVSAKPPSPPRSPSAPLVTASQTQEPASERTAGGRAEPPVVRVTIGRVDVRAVLPSPPAEHSRPKRAPRLTLDEYLREGRAQ